MDYLLLGVGISREQGFRAFSSLFGQALPVVAPAILGPAGWIWLLGRCCPEGPLASLVGARGGPLALVQGSGENPADRRPSPEQSRGSSGIGLRVGAHGCCLAPDTKDEEVGPFLHFAVLPAGDRFTCDEPLLVALRAFSPDAAVISPRICPGQEIPRTR